ncbi:MAG: RimK family alpha-L-glutamate ligase [Pasteurellaceae bacterium]|nr:RimK family alpha-L-glutamate ligase [Pasteurellaceae bacterium]
MKWLMLCREPRLYSCERLKMAAEKLGHQLDILDPNRFLLGLEQGRFHSYYQFGEKFDKSCSNVHKLPDYDGIIPRFGTASTEIGCQVLHHFELQGVPVLNNAHSFRLARNKWQSLQCLAAAGIPVPNTVIAGELVNSLNRVSPFSYPIIIKTLSGSQGVGVMLSENQSNAISLLDTLNVAKINTLTQQFVLEAKGQDIRAFVIGNRVVATMQRQGTEGEFRANIHQGGSAKNIILTDAEQQLAVKATQALGLDVAGVDLIRSENGLLVLEVNASPGLEMIEKVSGEPIAEQMIDYLMLKRST